MITWRLLKVISISIAVLFNQACSHPIEIVGQGDVTSASGDRNCYLEDFQTAKTNCTKNYAVGAYQETYYATPRPGWQFDHWGNNYCPNASPPNYDCSFKVSTATVYQFWGQTMPPLKAVFKCIDSCTPLYTRLEESKDALEQARILVEAYVAANGGFPPPASNNVAFGINTSYRNSQTLDRLTITPTPAINGATIYITAEVDACVWYGSCPIDYLTAPAVETGTFSLSGSTNADNSMSWNCIPGGGTVSGAALVPSEYLPIECRG